MEFGVNFAGKATLSSPSGSTWTVTPTYTWQSVPGSTWYYLWVNNASGTPVIQTWYTATDAHCDASTCWVTPTTALTAGEYHWWIQTWKDGAAGLWSDRMDFSILLPAQATLSLPSGSGTNQPTYTWNAVPGSTWYYLWVNDTSGTPVIQTWYTADQAGCASGMGTCSVTPSTTLSPGAHRWWVQTWSNVGSGPWSTPLDFTSP